ncbi:lantibiotic dehydratase [Bacillus cereus]|nr:lantibiotic dehydratase [Bacillus cereus]MDA1766866.1 lantibiotic dehydratase [Bacillus cereus]
MALKTSIDTLLHTFKTMNFFMVRSPLLPMEFYKKTFDNSTEESVQMEESVSQIKKLAKDPLIQEAIFVSSSSLYESIVNWENITDKKRNKQILNSFIKYLIRMSTRPTPFGLFSGVTYGALDTHTSLTFGIPCSHKKRARPDMDWILSLIHKLEIEPSILKQLKVHTNSIILDAGGRLSIPYNSQCGKQNMGQPVQIEGVSIRKTPVTDIVLELAQEETHVNTIITVLKAEYPDTPEDKMYAMLLQLVEKEYLLTELRPPLMISSPFGYLLEKLATIQGIYELKENLNEIQSLINLYNEQQLGNGLETVKELHHKMKKLAEAKNPLQVDLKLSNSPITLNNKVGEEIAKVAETLWKLSPDSLGLRHIEEYRGEFIEKYGPYREVPILELLDEDLGLGAPALYNYPESRRKPPQNDNKEQFNRENYLLSRLLEASKSNKLEICLDEKDINELQSSKPKLETLPKSLELYGNIVAESPEDIDNGDFQFVLGINPGSDGAGKTFGRFIDILEDETFMKSFQEIYIPERKSTDVIYAELVYLPAAGRAANVTLSHNLRDYEVVIGTNSSKETAYTLPVSDILVGATLDKFYLKSKSLGKQIIIKLSHMLNIQSSPNIYRFLAEIESEGVRQWRPFMWYSFDSSPFLPRVRVGKSIISLAKWNINNKRLGFDKNIDFETWKTGFYQWVQKWNMPRFVYQTIADNRILLDIYNPLHLEQLYSEINHLKENELISLLEKETNTLTSWSKDIEGSTYNIECVFPLMENQSIHSENILYLNQNLPPIQTNSDVVRKFPGSEWLYVKLYGNASREEELICWHIKNFCTELEQKQIIEKYFFMRYADPDQHIRLRFYGDPNQLCKTVLPTLKQWFLSLQEEGLLQKVDICTYEREIERYGGPELIDMAEALFHDDSKCVSDLLFLTRIQGTKLELDEIATVSVIHYLECFGLSFKDQLDWFNRIVSYKDYVKDFRKHRNTFMQIGNSNDHWSNLRETEHGSEILMILEQRQESIYSFIEKMKKVDQKQSLYNNIEDILGSIIHLHLNRLLGIDRQREAKIMAFVRHTLHNLRYLKEGMK